MQIQTSLQHVASVVGHYPRVFNISALMESLAQQHGEPPPATLMQTAVLDDLQLAANWEAVVDYVAHMNADGMHGHIPFSAFVC